MGVLARAASRTSAPALPSARRPARRSIATAGSVARESSVPNLPAALRNREADVPVSPIAIADDAGGEWPKLVREGLPAVFGGASQG